MAEQKELRRQSRAELIEIIYALQQAQAAEKEATAAQLATLQAEKDALQAKLDERTLQIDRAGSIAQAALDINKVFEAAQAAADQYLQSIQAKAAGSASEATGTQGAEVLAQAQKQADDLLRRTTAQCDAMVAAAQAQADARWEEFRQKVLHAAEADPTLQARLQADKESKA